MNDRDQASLDADPQSFLETFPSWLASLGRDAALLAPVVHAELPEAARRYVAASLNYVFKSLDLIPDGIDDLGFLDDAFVLRVGARLALTDMADVTPIAGADGLPEVMTRLASEAQVVQQFLGPDYPRLESYVKSLRKGAARGRTVDDILDNREMAKTFETEVNAWSLAYKIPSFTRDPRTLEKLRAFLNAKLT
jgi:uncharacterized membrane protein YkvA (DUF1232 family)